MAELTWKHHTVIQALLSRGPLSEPDFHDIFKAVTAKCPVRNEQLFDEYLLKINKAVGCVQLELRCCRNQYDGCVYYGLVNNISDQHSKMGTNYSLPQIAFYKAIIEAIVLNHTAHASIPNITALNQSPLPLSLKETTLQQLVNHQWLQRTPDATHIALGIRSFLDLRSWFRNNQLPSCQACNEPAVKAQLCHNQDCTVRLHIYCLNKFFANRKGGRVCPSCDTQWKFHGEDEQALEEEDIKPPTPLEQKLKRQRTNNTAEHTSQPRHKRVTRSSAHAR